MTLVLGIDPGATSGAIAAIIDGQLLDAIDMPCADHIVKRKGKEAKVAKIVPRLLGDELRELQLAALDDHPTVIIEKVHAMPNQGVTSTFNFGRSLGVIEGVVAGLGWPIKWVTPEAWKAHHGLIGEDKDAARMLAIETWPQLADTFKRKKDIGRADAALIAAYGMTL